VQIADREFFIGLVADGAGSTTDGGKGADIACGRAWESIIDTLRNDGDLSPVTDDTIRLWIAAARDAIAAEAACSGKRLKDYACTFLGVVAGPDHALFFQVGDGAIVVSTGSGEYETIFWPEQGEYANTTFFVTDDDFFGHLDIRHADSAPGEIALFTDGLQTLALSFALKNAHAGFFRPLFSALRQHPDTGFMDFSRQLAAFLTRDDVSARSDDDKTLVLAVRVQE
jgi:hypothetical protein